MLGRDLEVLPSDVAVHVLVLDPDVGEVDVAVEVRQPVIPCPVLDLFRGAVGPSVAVAVPAVALLQKALVLALQLAVQFDAEDARLARLEAFGGLQVGAIDLRVVTALARAVCARVERLVTLGAGLSVAFEQVATVACQRDRALMFVQGHALDEPLVFEVSEIAAGLTWLPNVALRDHPKRADRNEGPRFGTIQRVVAVATVHQLAVLAMWQVEIANEWVARTDSALDVPVSRLRVTLT
jgi:hypothetical protein